MRNKLFQRIKFKKSIESGLEIIPIGKNSMQDNLEEHALKNYLLWVWRILMTRSICNNYRILFK